MTSAMIYRSRPGIKSNRTDIEPIRLEMRTLEGWKWGGREGMRESSHNHMIRRHSSYITKSPFHFPAYPISNVFLEQIYVTLY